MDALLLEGVGLDHPGRPGVLRDVALRVAPGDLAVVEGRSGSGKSSLLGIAAGLQVPTTGTVHLFGKRFDATDSSASQLRANHIGLVFQHLHLLPELTVAENVELPLLLARWPRSQRSQRVAELVARFGLQAFADRHPVTLSGGEQQRVAICRALAPRPGLLLVDEPTSSLDEVNARGVLGALQAAAASGAAVLVASHDEVLRAKGTLYRLAQGRLVQVRA